MARSPNFGKPPACLSVFLRRCCGFDLTSFLFPWCGLAPTHFEFSLILFEVARSWDGASPAWHGAGAELARGGATHRADGKSAGIRGLDCRLTLYKVVTSVRGIRCDALESIRQAVVRLICSVRFAPFHGGNSSRRLSGISAMRAARRQAKPAGRHHSASPLRSASA